MFQRILSSHIGNSDPREAQNREKLGTLSSIVGLCVNIFLAISKIVIGIFTGSVAISADGFNNLSDAGGSLVLLVTVKLAQKPYDKDHPFGHGRIEYIGSLGVGLLIVVFAVELLKSSIESLMHPTIPDFSVLSVVLLVSAIVLKLLLWRFYKEAGDATGNSTIIAASKDSISDTAATSAVLICGAVAMLFGEKFKPLQYLDGIVGLIVTLLVFKAGYEVLKDTIDKLIGGKPDREKGRAIIDKLMSYEDILGVHDFILHDYGPGRCIASVHAEVDARKSIIAIHESIDKAESEILEQMNIPICIHMDPIALNDEAFRKTNDTIQRALTEMDPPLRMHDLRIVPGEKQINLIFDVMLQDGRIDQIELKRKISERIKRIDSRYNCVIRFDIDYFVE